LVLIRGCTIKEKRAVFQLSKGELRVGEKEKRHFGQEECIGRETEKKVLMEEKGKDDSKRRGGGHWGGEGSRNLVAEEKKNTVKGGGNSEKRQTASRGGGGDGGHCQGGGELSHLTEYIKRKGKSSKEKKSVFLF